VVQVALLAVPLAFGWMIITGSISFGSFAVGYLLSVAILLTMRTGRAEVQWKRLPDQILAAVVYVVTLARDVLISSIDVARRVIDPDLPLNAGIIEVPTQDQSEVAAAFSAHGITMTPGELVVDFDGAETMFVHCLDVEASGKTLDNGQTKRLSLLRRILGSSQ
jgi:multicomponent Na+:H+ antiporter subunit E